MSRAFISQVRPPSGEPLTDSWVCGLYVGQGNLPVTIAYAKRFPSKRAALAVGGKVAVQVDRWGHRKKREETP